MKGNGNGQQSRSLRIDKIPAVLRTQWGLDPEPNGNGAAPRLDDEWVRQAEALVADLFGTRDLRDRTVLDVDCGIGLFSLAARRMGARVTSFDPHPDSVDRVLGLRRRFFPDDPDWRVVRGSILDRHFLSQLGRFDLVYAWGVVHHTGSMWPAIENIRGLAASGGRVVLAVYNDRGIESRVWRRIKQTYRHTPSVLRPVLAAAAYAPYEVGEAFAHLRRGRVAAYCRTWTAARERTGTSKWADIKNWVGGYPYEYASAEDVVDFFERANFEATVVRTTPTLGCNEFLFTSTR